MLYLESGWRQAEAALASSLRVSMGLYGSCLALLTLCTHCAHLQVFDELDKIGRSLAEEAQDGGVPVHDGKGDIRKCPYYADKLGRLGVMSGLPREYGRGLAALTLSFILAGNAAAGCPYHTAVALAKQPIVQLILAACVAVAAGAAAWYVM